jgi:ribokinase
MMAHVPHAPLIVGLGRIGVAVSGLGPNLPIEGASAAELAALAITPGRGVAVALGAAYRLGCRARVVGSHGADPLGQLARTALREAGVDVELLRPIGTSACEIGMIAGDGTLRARFAGDVGEPIAHDVAAVMSGAAALLVDGSAPTEQLLAAAHARAAKLPVILAVAELHDATRELIASADILIISERAAGELAPQGELTDALDTMLGLGPRAVVITLGAKGAIGRHAEQIVRCPAFPSEALDNYGAGSVFHGAFTTALLSGMPFGRCIELAAAAAALSLRDLGAWSALPSREDVLTLVKMRRAS